MLEILLAIWLCGVATSYVAVVTKEPKFYRLALALGLPFCLFLFASLYLLALLYPIAVAFAGYFRRSTVVSAVAVTLAWLPMVYPSYQIVSNF